MIEKFTPEELAIIKKELGIGDEPSKKGTITHESRYKLAKYLRDVHDDKKRPMSTKYGEVDDTIYKLTDLITENFESGYQTNKYGNYTWRRTSVVLSDRQDNYKKVFDRLVDLFIEEHAKIDEKSKV